MVLVSNFSDLQIKIFVYILGVNILSYLIYKIDKRRAREKKFRIPEKVLLFFSIMGGSVGSLMSMVINKHKLAKKQFYIFVPFLIILHSFLLLYLINILNI